MIVTNQIEFEIFQIKFYENLSVFLASKHNALFNVSEFKPSLEFCAVGSGVYPWSLPWYTLLIYLKIDCLPDGK